MSEVRTNVEVAEEVIVEKETLKLGPIGIDVSPKVAGILRKGKKVAKVIGLGAAAFCVYEVGKATGKKHPDLNQIEMSDLDMISTEATEETTEETEVPVE